MTPMKSEREMIGIIRFFRLSVVITGIQDESV
jgi:hypothetical protein